MSVCADIVGTNLFLRGQAQQEVPEFLEHLVGGGGYAGGADQDMRGGMANAADEDVSLPSEMRVDFLGFVTLQNGSGKRGVY